ncbi:MAG: argininosuccinate synthase [Bacteroidota bacterium]
MSKVVLAYSGGLDTSYCVAYLKEAGYEVHAATVNTGSFSQEELADIEKRAFELGVSSFTVLEKTKSFYDNCIKYLVFGNVLKNHVYPLSVSAERMFQALAIANYARQTGAEAIAHGSTGAGNDQVRFDLAFHILVPQVKIITPIRDQKLSREEEVKFLQERGVDISWEKAQYSINKGLWGTSVGGKETLNSWDHLPEDAYPSQLVKQDEKILEILFEKGQLVAVDGQRFDHAVAAIEHLNDLATPYAVGRDIHVGDTIIGIKGRVGFEAAAPLIMIKAHQLLEKHTLSKWQMHLKDQLANWYGMLLHEGQFLEPVMRNIEGFLDHSQETVNGKVKIRLTPYRFEVLGVDSSADLMSNKFGTYGEMNRAWSGEDVKGFTKILANSPNIYYSVNDSLLQNFLEQL